MTPCSGAMPRPSFATGAIARASPLAAVRTSAMTQPTASSRSTLRAIKQSHCVSLLRRGEIRALPRRETTGGPHGKSNDRHTTQGRGRPGPSGSTVTRTRRDHRQRAAAAQRGRLKGVGTYPQQQPAKPAEQARNPCRRQAEEGLRRRQVHHVRNEQASVEASELVSKRSIEEGPRHAPRPPFSCPTRLLSCSRASPSLRAPPDRDEGGRRGRHCNRATGP